MMRINKYMSWALVPAFALALASCNDKNINEDYVPQPLTGAVAYFPADQSTTFEITSDEHTVLVPVYRAETTGIMTVEVYVTSLNEIENYKYQFEDAVTFADGEKIGYLHISYDPSEIEYDDFQQYELQIDDKYVTPYGLNTEVITLVYPAPWNFLGTGTYIDEMFGDETGPYTVETLFWQHALDPTRFRMFNPYYPANDEISYMEFQILQKGSTVNGTEVTVDNLVYFSYMPVMYLESFQGIVYVVWPGDLSGFEDESNWTHSYVAAYQEEDEDGQQLPGEIYLAPIYIALDSGYWAGDTSTEENVRIIFPDFKPINNSISVDYTGLLTTSHGTDVVASIYIGSDLTEVKIGIGSGANISNIAQGIEDGSISSIIVSGGGYSTYVTLPFDPTNEMGRYSIVAVGYIDDEVSSTGSTTFTYAGGSSDPNAGWTTLGYVDYTEAFICALYTTGTFTYSLEIQQKDSKPGYYRLVNPYGPAYPLSEFMTYASNMTTYLYIDASNPEMVRIPESPQTIIVDPNYGVVTCSDQIDYWMSQGYSEETLLDYGYYGTMVNGKITFNPGVLGIYEGNDRTPYQANLVVNSAGTDYEMNPSGGGYYAPFLVDVNAISTTRALDAVMGVATRTAPNYFRMEDAQNYKQSLDGSKYRLHVRDNAAPSLR